MHSPCMENVNYINYSMSLKIRQQSKFLLNEHVKTWAFSQIWHSIISPEKILHQHHWKNLKILMSYLSPNYMAYGYMTFLFYVTCQVCTMLYYVYQHLLYVLYQQYTWPVTKWITLPQTFVYISCTYSLSVSLVYFHCRLWLYKCSCALVCWWKLLISHKVVEFHH